MKGTEEMKKEKKILIGGQALRRLGHDRHTDDVDYLVNRPGEELFIHTAEGDLINAAAHNFLSHVWESVTVNEGVADAQTLFELKAWSWIQYLQNMDFRAAAKAEYDMAFLVRDHGIVDAPILRTVAHAGEMAELDKFVAGVRR